MNHLLGHIGLRSTPSDYCCRSLASVLGLNVSFPGNTTYLATQESYWSLQEASLSPTCIVIPKTAQDISEAISIVSSIESCRFAIKGHSHAPAAGFANINDGVAIDMTRLSSVAVNSDHTVASVGAGASWLDVYQYLDSLGLAIAGGRNGAVGVAGLTLGGGISYFAPRVGWACDNAVNFELVLASGEIVDANATCHPELFRALKGGGNNFGIVTRIDFAAFPQGQILGGNVVNDISYRGAVFEAFAEIATAPEYDIYASLVTGLVFSTATKEWSLSTTAIYTKPVSNPPVYQNLRKIPRTADTLNITNLSTLANETAPPLLNWAFFTGTYGVSATLLSRIFDSLNTTIYNFIIPGGISWSVAFEPLPTVITQHGDQNGGNSLGTSPKDGNTFVMLLTGIWSNTSSDALVEKTAQKMVEDINGIARSMGLLNDFQYINYADPSQDPIGSYGQLNVKRLRDVSKMYDPKGVFQLQVPGGFKLWSH
ncbi:FAD binding domain protein [Glonium stellatum]|uniref:FAD binding domain protein n=1 Tax=Glonium stellatum TaxID=574774 RepID=A0A8E2JPC5_9PEZI|nr:FAD binding domain protein [Glonium stellatum]